MSNLQIVNQAKPLIEKARKAFLSANEFDMNFAQEAGFAIQAFQNNTFLLKCNPHTIVDSIKNVALTGLSLNPALKYAYLVPRTVKGELRCILDVSYMGYIKILTDAGSVSRITADVIYKNDFFEYRKGSEPMLDHRPELLGERGEMVGAYAIAYFPDGGFQFEIMRKDEIEKIRATSESWKNEKARQYSPWQQWEDEMWKKTVVRRLFKMLPKTKIEEKYIKVIEKDHENMMEDVADKNKTVNLDDIFSDAVIVEDKPAEKQADKPVKEEKKEPKPADKEKEKELFEQMQREMKEEQEGGK